MLVFFFLKRIMSLSLVRFITCEGQYERSEEEDKARTGTPGHASRLHPFGSTGAQGGACKRRSRPSIRN